MYKILLWTTQKTSPGDAAVSIVCTASCVMQHLQVYFSPLNIKPPYRPQHNSRSNLSFFLALPTFSCECMSIKPAADWLISYTWC